MQRLFPYFREPRLQLFKATRGMASFWAWSSGVIIGEICVPTSWLHHLPLTDWITWTSLPTRHGFCPLNLPNTLYKWRSALAYNLALSDTFPINGVKATREAACESMTVAISRKISTNGAHTYKVVGSVPFGRMKLHLFSQQHKCERIRLQYHSKQEFPLSLMQRLFPYLREMRLCQQHYLKHLNLLYSWTRPAMFS